MVSIMGTVLAFIMSVIALSLPGMRILRRVLEPRPAAAFVDVVASGIMVVGPVFNTVLRVALAASGSLPVS